MSAATSHRAIPNYAKGWGLDQLDLPPGHRYSLYGNQFDGFSEKGLVVSDVKSQRYVIESAAKRSSVAHHLYNELQSREGLLFDSITPDRSLSIPAKTASSLLVGLGIEHITENGFSFTVPHGLPYLPGSSVKGILLDVAREVGETFKDKITEADLELYFGKGVPESDIGSNDGALKGHLTFWDVVIEPSMKVDGLTPHNKSYLEGKGAPVENEDPTPISFLAVAKGAGASFRVTSTNWLASTHPDWKKKIEQLLLAAFDYGFGSKTSVGYGRFEVDANRRMTERKRLEERENEQIKKREETERMERLATLSPFQRAWEEFRTERKITESSNPKVHTIAGWALSDPRFSDMKLDLAIHLKAFMQQKGSWLETLPTTKKGKPPKREDQEKFDQTKAVKAILDETSEK